MFRFPTRRSDNPFYTRAGRTRPFAVATSSARVVAPLECLSPRLRATPRSCRAISRRVPKAVLEPTENNLIYRNIVYQFAVARQIVERAPPRTANRQKLVDWTGPTGGRPTFASLRGRCLRGSIPPIVHCSIPPRFDPIGPPFHRLDDFGRFDCVTHFVRPISLVDSLGNSFDPPLCSVDHPSAVPHDFPTDA
jgi:hypothetical protein